MTFVGVGCCGILLLLVIFVWNVLGFGEGDNSVMFCGFGNPLLGLLRLLGCF